MLFERRDRLVILADFNSLGDEPAKYADIFRTVIPFAEDIIIVAGRRDRRKTDTGKREHDCGN